MLKYFSVSGYKNFDQPIELNFSDVHDYKFNKSCINDGLLGKVVIYEKYAVGKSNFARALCDVLYTWKKPSDNLMKNDCYLCVNSGCGFAKFRYVFQFGKNTVEYKYRKTAQKDLIYEKILIDGDLLVEFDRERPHNVQASGLMKLAPTLIMDFEKIDSILGYIVSNTPLDATHPLQRTAKFINSIVLDTSSVNIEWTSNHSLNFIAPNKGGVKEFEKLLQMAGINERLTVIEDPTGKSMLYFDTTPPLPFYYAASSGTKTLCSLFMLHQLALAAKDPVLVILDEFDAFYHYELAEYLVKKLVALPNVQVIFTTHNTALLSNRFLRPDCCFIMTKNKLTAFPNATKMELREGHNLEKLFIGGEFDE